MTITEWVLWILLVCSLIVCLWEEWTITKYGKELEDEMDYSSWLEHRLYNLENEHYGLKNDYGQPFIEYSYALWAEYYDEAAWKLAADSVED